MEKEPKILASRVVCESKYVVIREDDLEFSDGTKKTWDFASSRGEEAVRIVALTDQEELVFVKEYRGAAQRRVFKVPGGFVNPGEDPLETAKRELEEETGWRAGAGEVIAREYPTGGSWRDLNHSIVYLYDLKEDGALSREDGEQDMEVFLIPFEKAIQMMQNLEIEDAGSIYCVLALQKHLKK